MESSGRFTVGPELVFQLRDVRVSVISSSITEATSTNESDAIVSSDDTSLSMGSGVADEVRRAAGDSVAEELARRAPVRLGDVVVTAAGRLPVHYIFHAITTDRQRGVSATNLTIRSIARNVFKRCEDFGVKKICVPSFADSAETVGADRSTRLFVEALAEHLSQPTQLKTSPSAFLILTIGKLSSQASKPI